MLKKISKIYKMSIEFYEQILIDLMNSILEDDSETCHVSLSRIEQCIREIKSMNAKNKKTIENVILLSYFLIFFGNNQMRNFSNYQESLMKYLKAKFTEDEHRLHIHPPFFKRLVRFVKLINIGSTIKEMLNEEQIKSHDQIIRWLIIS